MARFLTEYRKNCIATALIQLGYTQIELQRPGLFKLYQGTRGIVTKVVINLEEMNIYVIQQNQLNTVLGEENIPITWACIINVDSFMGYADAVLRKWIDY